MTGDVVELPGQTCLEDVLEGAPVPPPPAPRMDPLTVQMFIPGTPVPQGSKRAFKHRHTGAVVMMDDNPTLKSWRAVVDFTARRAWAGRDALDGPVRASLVFYLPRPKHHYGTGRNAAKLKPTAPAVVIVKPDVDKLSRAVFDSLTTAGVWTDDCRAFGLEGIKYYADPHPPGVLIRLDWGSWNG